MECEKINNAIDMIKFKDKILNINKFNWGKLGLELIVVFLGVTAGFFLNNWRIQKQESQQEQKYLSGFLQDINDNIFELEDFVKADSLWLTQAYPIIKSLQKKNIKIDSAKIAIRLISIIKQTDMHTGTYENIINSGNLNIISNFQLKTKITNYHIAIRNIKTINEFFYKYYNDFIMPFIFEKTNILTGKFNNPETINTNRFSNVFIGYHSMIQQRIAANKELLKKSYSLKKELKNIAKFDIK